MSSSTNTSSHTRSRSLRVPPSNTLKPLPPPSGPSNVALFLTNLQLLNLDQCDDWPDITAVTFSTRDAQQNQKKRVQCVEWALYQLFSLWDPEETRNKLQPFYPPLEPLQSLNLRAALFRCLEQAKKGGVLGRDTVLRKTMLDECKGERLEEILAVFSNVVLKKVVQETPSSRHDALAQQLALENLSYTGERSVLTALILAHKGVLGKQIREKEESRARYQDFSDLLNLNERRIARRREQLKETLGKNQNQDRISSREARRLQDQVQQNWSGSPEWLETTLYGDSRASAGGILAARFDRLWRHVEAGSLGDLESKQQVGLLEQLEARVKDQEKRLAKWQDFSKTLAAAETTSPSKSVHSPTPGLQKIDLGFDKHQALQVGKVAEKESQSEAVSLEEYSRLIENMKSELVDVGKEQAPSKRGPLRTLLSERRRSSIMPASASQLMSPKEESFVENEGWSSDDDSEGDSDSSARLGEISPCPNPPLKDSGVDIDLENTSPEPPSVDTSPSRSPVHTPTKTVFSPKAQASTARKTFSGRKPRPISMIEVPPLPRDPIPSAQSPAPRRSLYSPSSRISGRRPRPASMIEAPLTPQEGLTGTASPSDDPVSNLESETDLADQILNSLSTASPSPKKLRHTLSLAERTRLTMARATHTQLSDLQDKFEIDDLPTLPIKSRPSIAPRTPSWESNKGTNEGLAERTRKSMAGFEAAQQKAHQSRRRSMMEAEKKQRKSSYFPKVEEEHIIPDISAIELLEGDPDYASVFKSRPKIKTSPSVSPSKKLWEEEDEGDDESN